MLDSTLGPPMGHYGVYAPLAAGLLRPEPADGRLSEDRLDRLYQRIVTDLDALLRSVGLRTTA